MLIDCHAHTCEPHFTQQQLDVLFQNAVAAGVSSIVTVSENASDARSVLSLADSYSIVKPAIGLHPVQPSAGTSGGSRSVSLDELDDVLQLIADSSDRIVCVGEIGLDFSPHVLSEDKNLAEEEKLIQKKVFARQIKLADQLSLPVNVHSRSAGHYALEVLRENNCNSALLHAFDGKSSYALKGVQDGYFFSIPPSVVRSPQKQKLVKALPLDRLVLESDSPALAAIKDQVNEPKNILIACQEIAKLKGIAVGEVQRCTTENAKKLFKKLQS